MQSSSFRSEDLRVRTAQMVQSQAAPGVLLSKPQAQADQNSKHVIRIDSAKFRLFGKPVGLQAPENAGRFSAHKFTRRSFVAMFLVGNSVRRIARFHHVAEATVENELRANLPINRAA